MDKSLIPQYLANCLAVARADNVMGTPEQAAVEEVRSEIGGRKSDLKKAQKLVESDEFVLTPVGRFSEKVRNVEDMIYVALTHRELAEAEKAQILPFIKEVGLNQAIVRALVSEARTRLSEGTVACPSCGAKTTGGAKFCAECGTSLEGGPAAQTGVQVEFSYPTQGISIEFAESSSASFDAAMAVAKSAPDFQACEKSRKKWYLATWPHAEIVDALSLAEALKGLRNREVYIDGESVQWDDVFGFAWCFRQRQEAYRPPEYCFGIDEDRPNIWGCRQARMDWISWADWFAYGKFSKKDVFEFDKNRITHELQTNLHKVRFCPCLRRNLVSKVLELFPERVRVSKRSGWEYRREYEEGPSSIKIVQKEVQDGFAYKEEFWTNGVSPMGYGVAADILKKALKACDIRDVSSKMLKGK